MTEPGFSLVRHTTDGVVRLALHGELDRDTTAALDDGIHDALNTDRLAELVIDLDALAFLGAAGITALLQGRQHATRQGAAYRISNPHDFIQTVLQISGTLDTLTDTTGDPGMN